MLLLIHKDPLTAETVGGMTNLYERLMVNSNIEKSPPTFDKRCGTTAGYEAHRYRKEISCLACREAHNERSRKDRIANPDREKAQALIYRQTNRKEINAKTRQKYKDDPEKSKTRTRAWAVAHPDRMKIYDLRTKKTRAKERKESRLQRYAENVEKERERIRKWRAENPEYVRESTRRRRARRLNAPSEPYTTQQILDLYGSGCHICKEPIDLNAPRVARIKGWERGLHLEHVMPLSRGGTDLIENVKPAHGLCNAKKHASISTSVRTSMAVETGRG